MTRKDTQLVKLVDRIQFDSTTRTAQDAISTYGLDGGPTELYPAWFGYQERITDLVDRGILNRREADRVIELLADPAISSTEPASDAGIGGGLAVQHLGTPAPDNGSTGYDQELDRWNSYDGEDPE